MASSLQKGISAAKTGRMHEALDHMKDAIIEEPQNADVWVWIAAIIDDLDKQEIFLKKALEIDPDNIPAQRGLSYLYKRRRDEASVREDHLSDHTSPISPFPSTSQSKKTAEQSGWSKLDMNDLDELTKAGNKSNNPKLNGGFFQNLPKLNSIEYVLIGIVVIVFCFIGLLAASALFNFDLPLGFLGSGQPSLISEPPYPGVFLYEDGLFFDIQQHVGVPKQDVGIPSSREVQPVIVFWQIMVDPEQVQLIYETGEYIPFSIYSGKSNANLIQAQSNLNPGLYCFQQSAEIQDNQEPFYWCFRVVNLASE